MANAELPPGNIVTLLRDTFTRKQRYVCSQVSCLGEVCGMIPFISRDNPNQSCRLCISIFLHAGLIHCCASLVIQWLLMRDLEKLVGWHRISLVYLVSGIGGNLASAIFVPYRPDVGPSASLAGLLAALFIAGKCSRVLGKPLANWLGLL